MGNGQDNNHKRRKAEQVDHFSQLIMNSFVHKILILILITLTAGYGCKKDSDNKILPDMTITATPAAGKTTDIFEIAAKPVTGQVADGQLFYRWDWNNDGIWDTRFSSNNIEKHRYYQAGNQVIKIEMIDGKKQVRSFTATIQVSQGYSPPKATFRITPATGNPTVEYTFDASETRDDEDSISQLEFRWDPFGDGRWLIPYSSRPIAKFKYSTAGFYSPKLQVKDPTGRFSTISRELAINLEDTLILADFTATPDSIEVNHSAILDASSSKYLPDTTQSLLYSWLLPGTLTWTDPVEDNKLSFLFRQKGMLQVSLKVINPATNFYNRVSKEFPVVDENRPPTARFEVACPWGNILTQFYFDAWTSTDDRLPTAEIEIRWDFDGDGNWDTPYSKGKEIYHQFSQPGTFNVFLQAKDDANQETRASLKITVSGNSNPTSFFRDPRDWQYYGTVTIGNQTWMSENLNYIIPHKLIPDVDLPDGTFHPWLCLFEHSDKCELLGKFYYVPGAINDQGKNVKICPPGWRLPTEQDWETLLNNIGGEQNGAELRFGGKFDFNEWYLGYAKYHFVYDSLNPWNPIPKDTLYEFKETYQKAWFFSTTAPYDPQNLRVDMWMMKIDRATLTTWTGWELPNIFVPARCLKDN
jgi:uncharacterized protein (TIGR02145 family)